MIFTVTYRSKTGAKAEVEIEAASRAACMAECKQRGIAPVGIRDGRASSRSRAAETAAPHAGGASGGGIWRAAILATAVLAVVGGGLWWWLGREKSQPSQPTKQSVAKQKPSAAPAASKPPAPKAAADAKHAKGAGKRPAAKSRPVGGAEAGDSAPPTVAAVETNAPATPPSPPPTFSNASDQVIAMALSPSEGGIPPIPLTPDMEKAFLKSLETEIVILDTDDEKVKEMKQAVIETRAEIKRLMDGGQTFAQIIREHQHLANENAKLRTDALIELKRLKESGDIQGAVQYKKAVNAAFAQMGIKELAVPVTEEEQAERDAARLERLRQRKEAAARASESAP